jgi:hypothetical protein
MLHRAVLYVKKQLKYSVRRILLHAIVTDIVSRLTMPYLGKLGAGFANWIARFIPK